ncbi:MAG: hypothetical protein ACMXYG_04625 [Candidatus Woesearchaeota archaeon]
MNYDKVMYIAEKASIHVFGMLPGWKWDDAISYTSNGLHQVVEVLLPLEEKYGILSADISDVVKSQTSSNAQLVSDLVLALDKLQQYTRSPHFDLRVAADSAYRVLYGKKEELNIS